MAITLSRIGTYETGIFDESAAEIPAYDPATERLFVVNADNGIVEVLDASNPNEPTNLFNIDFSDLGGGLPNSIAVKDGVLAVALEDDDPQENGRVLFFSTDVEEGDIEPLSEVEVGALPDMIVFSPDGTNVLTANEGEPNDDYSVDPEGSISIIDISGGVENLQQSDVTTADFNAFDSQIDDLRNAGVRIFGPDATVSQDLEPEYIAISPDSSTAYVALQENNALAVVDIAAGEVTAVVPLGFKDHSLNRNGLDASDDDDTINIRPWPIFGMYQPDAIAAYEVDGTTYLVTANEGDAREYILEEGDDEIVGFVEEERIEDLELDPTAFPNAEALQNEARLGRLTVTTTLGDTDGDGDFDELYAFGARSFTIWDTNGNIVFDSGRAFEDITAERFPDDFNSTNDENGSFDSRSDAKGPEPEGVVLGEINGRTFAFIGLERIGGVMVYDISNPEEAEFVQYINPRDFSGDAEAGTAGPLGPEGLAFISGSDSPTGDPLLVVSNEVSGSTDFFAIDYDLADFATEERDVLRGLSTRDTVDALAGNDSVSGQGGNDRLAGGGGNDRLAGNEGNDRLLGGAGRDRLVGGADDDTLLGGAGNDRLTGNLGNDRLVGGAGVDTLLGGAGDDVLVAGADGDRLLGGGGNDTLRGNLGNDLLNGGAGNDTLFGGDGDDTLNAQGGDDVLRGGAGDDVLRGGAGNDRLIGELGDDIIVTEGGRDRVAIRSGQGFDRVQDFNVNLDRVDLLGLSFSDLTFSQQVNGAVIAANGENLLLLNNVNVSALTPDIFV
ncbi:MAG: choice-of-anchor I family protein [Cyanobacteria bacterium J06638_20]